MRVLYEYQQGDALRFTVTKIDAGKRTVYVGTLYMGSDKRPIAQIALHTLRKKQIKSTLKPLVPLIVLDDGHALVPCNADDSSELCLVDEEKLGEITEQLVIEGYVPISPLSTAATPRFSIIPMTPYFIVFVEKRENTKIPVLVAYTAEAASYIPDVKIHPI